VKITTLAITTISLALMLTTPSHGDTPEDLLIFAGRGSDGVYNADFDLATCEDGGFLLAWTRYGSECPTEQVVQRFDSDLEPAFDEPLVVASEYSSMIAVACNWDLFAVAWTASYYAVAEIHWAWFDAGGVRQSQGTYPALTDAIHLELAVDSRTRQLAIAWEAERDGGSYLYFPPTTVSSENFAVGPNSEPIELRSNTIGHLPSLASTHLYGEDRVRFLALWHEGEGEFGVFARFFRGDGSPEPPDGTAVQVSPKEDERSGRHRRPSAALGSNTFLALTWDRSPPAPELDLIVCLPGGVDGEEQRKGLLDYLSDTLTPSVHGDGFWKDSLRLTVVAQTETKELEVIGPVMISSTSSIAKLKTPLQALAPLSTSPCPTCCLERISLLGDPVPKAVATVVVLPTGSPLLPLDRACDLADVLRERIDALTIIQSGDPLIPGCTPAELLAQFRHPLLIPGDTSAAAIEAGIEATVATWRFGSLVLLRLLQTDLPFDDDLLDDEFLVLSGGPGDQSAPQAAFVDGSGLFVAWEDRGRDRISGRWMRLDATFPGCMLDLDVADPDGGSAAPRRPHLAVLPHPDEPGGRRVLVLWEQRGEILGRFAPPNAESCTESKSAQVPSNSSFGFAVRESGVSESSVSP
jgi:hypothetical protein